MIKITDKSKCCGCTACQSVCPKQCITMIPDEEGFAYPSIDRSICINCKMCEKVCPILSFHCEVNKIDSYSGIIDDDKIRLSSSSGGIFWALSSYVIEKGGVVFGASFDKEWNVIHTEACSLEQLVFFKGSKYVQSSLNGVYHRVNEYLQKGISVLFSGTPCQIAGLKSYLRNNYEKLLLVEIACHGVPSPLLWQNYLKYLTGGKTETIKKINFRDKLLGWKYYRITIDVEGFPKKGSKRKTIVNERPGQNLYLGSFQNNLSLRPSCYECKFKSGASGADITLGDYWGIPASSRFNDNRGASVIMVNSDKGRKLISEIPSIRLDVVEYNEVVKHNHCLVDSVPIPESRLAFWECFRQKGIRGTSKFTRPKKTDTFKQLLLTVKRRINLIFR